MPDFDIIPIRVAYNITVPYAGTTRNLCVDEVIDADSRGPGHGSATCRDDGHNAS